MMTVGIPRTLAQKVSARILLHLDTLQPALRLAPSREGGGLPFPEFEPIVLNVDPWTAQHALAQIICWRGMQMLVTNCRWTRRPATANVTLQPLWTEAVFENPSVRTLDEELQTILEHQVRNPKELCGHPRRSQAFERATVKVSRDIFSEVVEAPAPYSLRWRGVIAVVETATEKWRSSPWESRVREDGDYYLTFSFYPFVE